MLRRVKEVLTDMGTECFRQIAVEAKVSTTALYTLVNSQVTEPRIETLRRILKVIAPGYRIAIVEGEEGPIDCPVPAWKQQMLEPAWPPLGWRVHPDDSRAFYNMKTREVLWEDQLRKRIADELAARAAAIAPKIAAE
jgi:hypothetical protein